MVNERKFDIIKISDLDDFKSNIIFGEKNVGITIIITDINISEVTREYPIPGSEYIDFLLTSIIVAKMQYDIFQWENK